MPQGSPLDPAGPATTEQSDTPRPLAGLVLCGGASRRMGVDKATLRLDDPHGPTLLERAAAVLADAGASPILVATGTRGRLGDLPWTEVDDGDHRGQGPLAGVLAGLHASAHPLVAVLAVDLPAASAALLTWLADELDDHPTAGAAIPVDRGGRPQPLHAVYRTDAAPAIDAYLRNGHQRVLPVLDGIGARHLTPPTHLAPDGWARNLNTPADRSLGPTPPRVG